LLNVACEKERLVLMNTETQRNDEISVGNPLNYHTNLAEGGSAGRGKGHLLAEV